MAGLTAPTGGASPRDRGQLLLVGAFGVAVFLLVIAGVLNTITYTESVASRPGDVGGGRDVAALQDAVRSGTGGIVARVNRGNGTYSQKVSAVRASVGNWSDAAERQYVESVTAVNVSVETTTEGSLVTQTTARNLTNASGAGDWTVASGVSRTRGYELNLSRSSLTSGSCGAGDCFTLVVDDGSAEWRLLVNQSYVVVDGPGSRYGRCAVGADPVALDVTGGTVDGRSCAPLAYAEGLSAPYEIRYENGTEASGTYRLLVNVPESAVNDSDYAASGSPAVSPAVYATAVEIDYRTPSIEYSTQIRVARGEPDD